MAKKWPNMTIKLKSKKTVLKNQNLVTGPTLNQRGF